MATSYDYASTSSSSSSEDSSVYAHPCRWGWCRECLPTKDALIAHLLEHTKRVVPVRRKDVALLRRIEEGTQSLRTSFFRDSLPSSVPVSQPHHAETSSQGILHKALPSPPHSSGIPRTPSAEPRLLPQDDGSSSSSSSDSDPNEQYVSPELYPQEPVAVTPSGLRYPDSPGHATPTFASLNSPTNSQASQASRVVPTAIPDSPPFSSLVKRKSEANHPQRLSRFNPSSQSRESSGSSGSTGSQMSVEKQLTQSPRSDIESDANASPQRAPPINDSFSSSRLDGDITMSQNLYAAELAWDRAQEPEDIFMQAQAPSQPVEFELLTQPPSQLQLGTFPFHNHRRSQRFPAPSSQAEPASSIPFRPSPPVPVAEKTFAASTPQPQPTRRQTRSQSRGPEPAPAAAPAPAKAQNAPVKRTNTGKSIPRTPKPKSSTKPNSRSFRSGTLQITPLPQPSTSTIAEETTQQLQQQGLTAEELLDMHNPLHHFNGSPGRSQSSFESMDFAELQTQAPYESQPMTQY